MTLTATQTADSAYQQTTDKTDYFNCVCFCGDFCIITLNTLIL